MKQCTSRMGIDSCKSTTFTLDTQGIDQGDLCDLHYWQKEVELLKFKMQDTIEQIKKLEGNTNEGI